ncbi:hypothetical protein KCTCHS21_57510 [Cohnella abietis]|uniref:Uncharacterized protein n=1 Tax=Cohnella abietis TaxID=2507935 RepID=A0A3T1DE30_9BACL|nr:hypothetical protein KCTCHS21_57510 [Cohnella abietis]
MLFLTLIGFVPFKVFSSFSYVFSNSLATEQTSARSEPRTHRNCKNPIETGRKVNIESWEMD